MLRETNYRDEDDYGTTRAERSRAALRPDYIQMDERSLPDLLSRAVSYAENIRFVEGPGALIGAGEAVHTWAELLSSDEAMLLARIQTTELAGYDEAMEHHLVAFQRATTVAEKYAALGGIVTALVDLTTLLFDWERYARALLGWQGQHRLHREIERALRDDLGTQLAGFWGVLDELDGADQLPKAIRHRLEPLKTSWQDLPGAAPLALGRQESTEDWLYQAGFRLREYYRQLYFTLSYVRDLSADLLQQSLHQNDHQPQTSLLIAFLELFGLAQKDLNGFTRRHLDYYYRGVLGGSPRGGGPGRVIVALNTSGDGPAITVPTGTLLEAGLTDEGDPIRFRTLRDLSVSPATVAELRTLYVSKNPLVDTGSSYRLVTAVYAAPIANSADGLGAEFAPGAERSWPILGEDQFDLGSEERRMRTAELGFALATSVLRLGEGERFVRLRLAFDAYSFSSLTGLLEDMQENADGTESLAEVFQRVLGPVFRLAVTTGEGWHTLPKFSLLPPEGEDWSRPELSFEFTLPPAAPPLVGYDAEVHGPGFTTNWPVLRVGINAMGPLYGYSFLQDLKLDKVDIEARVIGLRTLTGYNGQGLLETSLPFAPFGPLPQRNSYLLIGHTELFDKPLASVTLRLKWGGLPAQPGGFTTYYQGYDRDINTDAFGFQLSALVDFAFQPSRQDERRRVPMFTATLPLDSLDEDLTVDIDRADLERMRFRPTYGLDELPEFGTATQTGYFRLGYTGPDMAFGHLLYPRLFAEIIARNARPQPFSLLQSAVQPESEPLPNEPYTPFLDHLALDYSAHATIDLRPEHLRNNDPAADDRLYRLQAFGTEEIYAAGHLRSPYLVPQYEAEGYLFIGLRDLRAPQTISLFFDIHDGKVISRRDQITLTWSYRRGQDWVEFPADALLSDGTAQFSTRGLVEIRCPRALGEPVDGLHWLRVAGSGNLHIPGRCTQVQGNAVEAALVVPDLADNEVSATITPGEISGLASPIPGVDAVSQLTPLYGGLPGEGAGAFDVRTSERLRHKGRAITKWDIERIVLARFRDLHQVKCIGPRQYPNEVKVGQALVVIVPQARPGQDRPVAGYHLLEQVTQLLGSLDSQFSEPRVINPRYESLKINCAIKLTPGGWEERGRIWRELHERVRSLICPWREGGKLPLGGSVSKTEVLGVISGHPEVRYVTGFSMVQIYEEGDRTHQIRDTARRGTSQETLKASRPYSVLIPVAEHQFTFLQHDEYQHPTANSIDTMQVGADFIIESDNSDDQFENPPDLHHRPPPDDDDYLYLSSP